MCEHHLKFHTSSIEYIFCTYPPPKQSTRHPQENWNWKNSLLTIFFHNLCSSPASASIQPLFSSFLHVTLHLHVHLFTCVHMLLARIHLSETVWPCLINILSPSIFVKIFYLHFSLKLSSILFCIYIRFPLSIHLLMWNYIDSNSLLQ